jgi:hypothetical protein
VCAPDTFFARQQVLKLLSCLAHVGWPRLSWKRLFGCAPESTHQGQSLGAAGRVRVPGVGGRSVGTNCRGSREQKMACEPFGRKSPRGAAQTCSGCHVAVVWPLEPKTHGWKRLHATNRMRARGTRQGQSLGAAGRRVEHFRVDLGQNPHHTAFARSRSLATLRGRTAPSWPAVHPRHTPRNFEGDALHAPAR